MPSTGPPPACAGNWPPEDYSPQTGYLYIPANDNLCSFMKGREVEYIPGQNFTGAEFEVFKRDGADHIGELQAWDLDTGERGWNHELPSRTGGAVLTTAGGLVFLGGGDFRAFHAWSGRLLWRIRTNYLRTGVPASYAVHGVQYIAVQSGA